MNPTNVICWSCGKDVLIEPEVEMDDEALCPNCKGPLWENDFDVYYPDDEEEK